MLMIPVMGNTAAASGAAAGAAAAARAVKASGTIVRVEPNAFSSLLRRVEAPLIVHCETGFFSRKHRYLSSYKGLAFYTQSPAPVELPARCELVEARSIWMP